MIRLLLETADIERLLQGKTVTKHKSLAGSGRAGRTGVVIEVVLPHYEIAALYGALNRIVDKIPDPDAAGLKTASFIGE